MSSSSTTTTTTPSPRPLYFWRPHTEGTGYLSQWYPSPFPISSTHYATHYATAEMWMMVQKARLFGDEETAAQMLSTEDPKVHKALGRKVRGFQEGKWDAHKYDIVVEGNMHKFTKSEDAESLRAWLLATGERELVEASPADRVWGVGFTERDAGRNRERWGQNLLGAALEEVRRRLRDEEGRMKQKREGEAGDVSVA